MKSYEKREANQGQATVINEPLGLKDYNLVLLQEGKKAEILFGCFINFSDAFAMFISQDMRKPFDKAWKDYEAKV